MSFISTQDGHKILDEILRTNRFYLVNYSLLESYAPVSLYDPYLWSLKKLVVEVIGGCRKFNETKLPCVIREFRTSQLFVLFPLIFGLRKKLYFLNNHNIQMSQKELYLLSKLGIKFLFIDFQHVDYKKMTKNSFNISSDLKSNQTVSANKNTVLIFSASPQKIISKIDVTDLKIYIANRDTNEVYNIKENIYVHGTKSEKNYRKALDTFHSVIIDYPKEDYYYRSSGIIWDAIKSGNYIITNNYPVFDAQVENYQRKQFFYEFNEIRIPSI